VLHALEAAGTDVIELGIPFSDPLADGPTIQAASGRALAAGMTVSGALELVRRFRQTSELPVVLFTYLNPIYVYGFDRFLGDASAASADGLLILDLPPDEADRNAELIASGGLDPIRLIAPTTPPARMAQIAATGRGFIYYVSREGVTGEQTSLSDTIAAQVAEIRRHTALPIAVGFGISTPEQSAAVAQHGDAVVVGSAIVRRIAENAAAPDLADRIAAFVRPLVQAAKSA
jgi:tryptophan synthase alpha chain